MYLPILFREELKSLICSRRFLFSLTLIFLPAAIGAWFSHMLYHYPSIIARMTGGWLTQVNPQICTMVYLEVAPLPIALIAIIHASDFIAGERSRRTLSFLACKPVARGEILLGKYLSFLLIFLLLITLNMSLFAISLAILRIGQIPGRIFLSYTVSLFCTGIVYVSICTLFSVLTMRTLVAILAGFLLLITWYIFDWMVLYLPQNTAQILEKFSLSYYANRLVSYISNGKAALFLGGGLYLKVNLRDFFESLIVIFGLLGIFPLVIAAVILRKQDIHGH